MKRIAILALISTVSCLYGQSETHVFEFKYAKPSELARLLGYNERSGTDDLRKIWIFNGSKEQVERIETFIKRYDVPPPPVPNVEVTIYLMSALGQPSTTSVPPELESVIKQLKSMFSYKAYQLIDTQVIRARAGQRGQASGVVDNGSTIKTVCQVQFKTTSVSNDEKGKTIRIDGLEVSLKIPVKTPPMRAANSLATTEYQYLNTGISTDVDVHEGQKVVVGKANMDGSDRASIVVLTAKVVD